LTWAGRSMRRWPRQPKTEGAGLCAEQY
jgi:hypothetical protein